jgi:hypothetical protein
MAAITLESLRNDIIEKYTEALINQRTLFATSKVFLNNKEIAKQAYNITQHILLDTVFTLEYILNKTPTLEKKGVTKEIECNVKEKISKMSTEELKQSIQEIISKYNNVQ